jgi:hypothetical protein
MNICDLCIEEGNFSEEAVTTCKSCRKDICERHTKYVDGYRLCTNCAEE